MIKKFNLKVKEIQAKSILTSSKLPGTDWVINPYVGCIFGCKYCYAAFIGRWKHPNEKWGEFIDVKINSPKLLKATLLKLERKNNSKDFGSIFFSSVTDPYVGVEAKYKITRKCLRVLIDFNYQGKVSILTKSPLVVRDIDLFKKLNVAVGLTITTLENNVARFLESKAPLSSDRIKALKKFNQVGLNTYVFVGPLLPYFTAKKQKLDKLFLELEKTGTKEIWLEHINLSPRIKNRLFEFLRKEDPNLISEFQKADSLGYRNNLEKIIKQALKGKKLKMAMSRIIYHRKPS